MVTSDRQEFALNQSLEHVLIAKVASIFAEHALVRVGIDERDMLIEADPEAFFITEHYRAYPSVLARMSKVHPATLRRLIGQAWRAAAPKRLVADFDERRAG